MTITTTVTISHEELCELKLKDEDFRSIGYNLKASNSYGKVYEKIAWQTANSEKPLECIL